MTAVLIAIGKFLISDTGLSLIALLVATLWGKSNLSAARRKEIEFAAKQAYTVVEVLSSLGKVPKNHLDKFARFVSEVKRILAAKKLAPLSTSELGMLEVFANHFAIAGKEGK